MANRWENSGNSVRLYFGGLQNHCRWLTAAMKLKDTWLHGRKTMTKPRWSIEKQKHCFASKGLYSQSYGFSSSHVWMWELDHEEGWMSKNWCFWTVVLEKTLESPLDCKEIKAVSPKGNQPCIHWKDWCWSLNSNTFVIWCKEPTHWKRPWCWERLKVGGESEATGWDGWLATPTNGHEFEQALGDGQGQGSLACCSPWGPKESDRIEWLNNKMLDINMSL